MYHPCYHAKGNSGQITFESFLTVTEDRQIRNSERLDYILCRLYFTNLTQTLMFAVIPPLYSFSFWGRQDLGL